MYVDDGQQVSCSACGGVGSVAKYVGNVDWLEVPRGAGGGEDRQVWCERRRLQIL